MAGAVAILRGRRVVVDTAGGFIVVSAVWIFPSTVSIGVPGRPLLLAGLVLGCRRAAVIAGRLR